MSDWNTRVIEEFRANDGKVSGMFADRTMLLLNTVGAKSGTPRTVPLVTVPDAGRYLIVGSAGGSDKHPAWYHNLVANPAVTAEVGAEHLEVDAVLLKGTDREAGWNTVVTAIPGFNDYLEKTTREIPVFALVPR